MGTSMFEFISLCYYVVVNEKDGGEIGPTSPDPSESSTAAGIRWLVCGLCWVQ